MNLHYTDKLWFRQTELFEEVVSARHAVRCDSPAGTRAAVGRSLRALGQPAGGGSSEEPALDLTFL